MNLNLSTEYPHAQIAAIEVQRHTYRFNTMPMLKPQSDAVHIGTCVQLMVLVIRDLKSRDDWPMSVRPETLYQYMALHDIGESITGDVIFDVKHAVPGIAEYEQKIVDGLFGTTVPYLNSTEAIIAKSVDVAEFVVTCCTERELGNTRILPWLHSGYEHLRNLNRDTGLIAKSPTLSAILTKAHNLGKTGWRP